MSNTQTDTRRITRAIPLHEAVEINPKLDRRTLADDLDVSFVPMAAVGAASGEIDVSTIRKFADVKKGYTYFRDGDVLFAKVTPCMENGKMAIARQLHNGIGFGSTEFHVLRPRADVDAHYVYHFVSSETFRKEASRHMTGAVGLRRVPTAFLENSEIPLPDIYEQQRIVAEIEKQFSRLDEAVANLKRVKGNLKRYKAAVLKAAVEGRLVPTEAELAKKEGRAFERGSELLHRILNARRKEWKAKGKYAAPMEPSTETLPVLVEGWSWSCLDQVTSKITSGSRDWSPFYNRGTGIFVLAQNVRPLFPDFSNKQFVDPPVGDSARDRSRIAAGDLLATIVGANAGQVCMIELPPDEAYVCQSVALIRPVVKETAEYLNYWFNSAEHGQRYFERCMYGQGRPHLSFDQLAAMPIALPPLLEQRRIVAEVERQFSLIHGVERQIAANLIRAEKLRAAVLTRTFSTTISTDT